MARQQQPDGSHAVRAADGMFTIDGDQRVRGWTPAAEAILGYTADEVEGRPCWKVICGVDPRGEKFCERDCSVVRNANRGRLTPSYDVQSRRADGTPVWLNMSVLFVAGGPGDSPHLVHLFHDVTHQRWLEGQARRSLNALHGAAAAPPDEDQALPPTDAPGRGHGDEAAATGTPVLRLSKREAQVLRLLALGQTTDQIAESLAVSRVTARNHISRVLAKLDVRTRLQAVVYASRHGLV